MATRKMAEPVLKDEPEVEPPVDEPTTDEPDDRSIYQRLIAIAREAGVLVKARGDGVPFEFRGIDQVVAHLSPLLNKHGVIVVPVGASQTLDPRPIESKGVSKTLTKAELTVTYRFYGENGDYLDAEVPGQADDFADRSTAQAMSVALRILLLQVFHIPAFGNEEAASEETKNTREAAGVAKVNNARAKSSEPDPVEQMRQAILSAATRKQWDTERINKYASEDLALPKDWFDNPEHLNTLLSKINEAA